MLIIREIHHGGTRTEIGRAADVYEAVQKLPGEIVLIEEDASHPDCYDAMMQTLAGLRQFTIEPEDFRIAL